MSVCDNMAPCVQRWVQGSTVFKQTHIATSRRQAVCTFKNPAMVEHMDIKSSTPKNQ